MAEQKFEINKIYTKDISVESPNNPEIFKQEWNPNINLNIGNATKKIEDDIYEVSITLTITAKLEEKTAYIIEVVQSGVFTLAGFEEEQKQYMLGAMIPNILFPYGRETISTLSQKAGFPAMLLNPIDFNGLYQQHLEEAQKEQAEKNQLN